jgi:hypothetical protein
VHYGYTKSVASISNHVTMCSVTCSVLAAPTWPLLENQGSQNSHSRVTVFCSMPLVFRKSGVLRTVNGAACKSHQLMVPKSNLHSNGPQVTPTNTPQVPPILMVAKSHLLTVPTSHLLMVPKSHLLINYPLFQPTNGPQVPPTNGQGRRYKGGVGV